MALQSSLDIEQKKNGGLVAFGAVTDIQFESDSQYFGFIACVKGGLLFRPKIKYSNNNFRKFWSHRMFVVHKQLTLHFVQYIAHARPPMILHKRQICKSKGQ